MLVASDPGEKKEDHSQAPGLDASQKQKSRALVRERERKKSKGREMPSSSVMVYRSHREKTVGLSAEEKRISPGGGSPLSRVCHMSERREKESSTMSMIASPLASAEKENRGRLGPRPVSFLRPSFSRSGGLC